MTYLAAAIRKDRATPDEIERLVAKLEPAIASVILAALKAQAQSVSLDAIASALQSGDVSRVVALLNIDSLAPIKPPLINAVGAAGATAVAAQVLPRLSGVQFVFDTLNPRLISWLQDYSFKLIREINDGTKEAIRGVLVSGMTAGRNPRDVAREVKPVIGLTERQAKAVQNFRRELETFHLKRSAAGWNLGGKIDRAPGGAQVFKPDEEGLPQDGIRERRLRDFRFDASLKRAMATGKPLSPAQVDKMVSRYSERYLKYRAQTIARTEALRTTNMGVQEAWRQAIEAGKVSEALVRRQWIVSRDERLCQWCAPIPKLNPKLGVIFGQPFSTPKGPSFLPPVHPNCRCTVMIRVYEPSQIAP